MLDAQPVSRLVDLLDPSLNVIYGMSVEAARERLASGRPADVRGIRGHFALVAQDGLAVRMARTIGRVMRYFIAKHEDGPILIVSDRIDRIHDWLRSHELADQFHPSYTRMVPAHYVVEVRLVGCPDPNPTYQRFLTPPRGTLPADLDVIAERYVGAVCAEVARWLERLPAEAPIGVCFSGGIDSGSVFLLAYHALLSLGQNPARLKAFTLAVDGGGGDLTQARSFLDKLDLTLFLEPIEVARDALNLEDTIRVVEDYKPLDVQAAAVALALCRGIRRRYPSWEYLLDGDGGDENLKDYPIEENPELTIRSVLNNPLLYQEGWGVGSIKHSLTYSGGQSRGHVRTYAPAVTCGFKALSPFTAPSVIEVAEAIPFIELTDWDVGHLYGLKGEIMARGVRAVTGFDMPVFAKRRFQHGALSQQARLSLFPADEGVYRRTFHAIYE